MHIVCPEICDFRGALHLQMGFHTSQHCYFSRQQNAMLRALMSLSLQQGSFAIEWPWKTHDELCSMLLTLGACISRAV